MRSCILVILVVTLACPLLAQEEAPKPKEPAKEPPAEKKEPEKPRELTSEEIAAAVKSLSARFDEERKEARRKLIQAGERAVVPLLALLKDELPAQRAAAAEILGFIGAEAAAPELVKLIRDKDLSVRSEARKALARIGPAAIKYLAKALEEGTEAQRKEFDLAVRKMVSAIIKNLVAPGDEYGDYPGQFDDMKKIGRYATAALVDMAKNASKTGYRYLAITALGRLGDKAAIPALKDIYDSVELFKDDAAISLAQLGDDSYAKKVIEDYLVKSINEPNEYGYPANLALFYHKLEKWKDAEVQYKRAIEIAPDQPGPYYNYACLLSVRGRLKEGMAALKKSLEKGYSSAGWIMRDKELDNLRKLPEFKQLIEKRFGKAAGAE